MQDVLSRDHLALMMEAGYILLGMRRFDEAREVMEGIAVMAPESDIPQVAMGSVAFCEGKFKTAMKCYQKALKLNPNSSYAKAYMGESLFFMGETDKAKAALNEAISADTDGKTEAFAKALLEAIAKGYTPGQLSGEDEIKAYESKRKA